MPNHNSSGFLADGHRRAVKGIEEEVRAEVLAEYAPLLESASWSRRLLLMQEARSEMRRRVEQIVQAKAPPDASIESQALAGKANPSALLPALAAGEAEPRGRRRQRGAAADAISLGP